MGFVDARKSERDGDPDERKWVICTTQEILYTAPINGEKNTPRQGRWELGDTGAAPAPTVNLQPLPTAFRLSGWIGHNAPLNGEYLPLDDGSKLLNGHVMFKHTPLVGLWAGRDKHRMFWSHGAWRIGDKDQMQTDQKQCMAFVESNDSHPTAISGPVWKGTANGRDVGNDENDFEVVKGVSAATGTVRHVGTLGDGR